jgi:hypothetical protein
MAIVVSASRRTDIPAFYMDGFMAAVAAGFFETVNPFNGKTAILPCGPEQVAAIVFWSKNFDRFLDQGFGEILVGEGYRLFFNFTVNSADPLLEPNLPPLTDRLRQMRELARRFGPRKIQWRFDPICHYRHENGPVQHNLADLEAIARTAAACGVRRCVTSFVDPYAKAKRRFAAAGCQILDLSVAHKAGIVDGMAALLSRWGIGLDLCCEPAVLAERKPGSGVGQSRCISHDRIMSAGGRVLSRKPDAGQRRSKGCGCHVAVDIGDYRRHPCGHRCLYCYANARPDTIAAGR